MKSMIVEDEFTSRLLLQRVLTPYGECHIAVNGEEAIKAFGDALDEQDPYQLLCMDIRLPGMDGIDAVKRIRALEEKNGVYSSRGVKILMTTMVDHLEQVLGSFHALCDAYLVKPIDVRDLRHRLQYLDLIS